MKPVHIKGLGLVGSVVARTLAFRNIPFTWSDNDVDVTAWKACTGSVCPEDDDPQAAISAFEYFANDSLSTSEYCTAPYHKYVNGRWIIVGLGRSHHVNVQSLVLNTRETFKFARRPGRPVGSIEIRTAGSLRAQAFWWGWSIIVSAPNVLRACWTARVVRQSRYIYPRPGGRNEFYLGSSITFQRQPKNLDVYKHWGWFLRDFIPIFPEGAKQILDKADPTKAVVGWRPVGEPGKWQALNDGDIIISPMAASGCKFAPFVAEEIAMHLATSGGR